MEEKMTLFVNESPTKDDAAEMLRKALEAAELGNDDLAIQFAEMAACQLRRRKPSIFGDESADEDIRCFTAPLVSY
jgi:hypothetical protein